MKPVSISSSPCLDWLEALQQLVDSSPTSPWSVLAQGGQRQQQSTGWGQPERAADASVSTYASLSLQEHTPNWREPPGDVCVAQACMAQATGRLRPEEYTT